MLSSRDTYLSAGANRNAFIAAAVRKIKEDWKCTIIPRETMIDLRLHVDSIYEIESVKLRFFSFSKLRAIYLVARNLFNCKFNSQKYRNRLITY